MLQSAQECPICPNPDIHRVHEELFRFESIRRSDQEFFWTSRLNTYVYRNAPVLTQVEVSELLRKLRQHVSDELNHKAARGTEARSTQT